MPFVVMLVFLPFLRCLSPALPIFVVVRRPLFWFAKGLRLCFLLFVAFLEFPLFRNVFCVWIEPPPRASLLGPLPPPFTDCPRIFLFRAIIFFDLSLVPSQIFFRLRVAPFPFSLLGQQYLSPLSIHPLPSPEFFRLQINSLRWWDVRTLLGGPPFHPRNSCMQGALFLRATPSPFFPQLESSFLHFRTFLPLPDRTPTTFFPRRQHPF